MAFKGFEFDTDFAGPQSYASMYRHVGVQVVPALKPGEDPEWKRPIFEWKEFSNNLVPDAVFARWYGPDGQYRQRPNMGAITGAASGGLVVVDIDGEAGLNWWNGLLAVHNNNLEPETPSQRTGGGGRQIFFRVKAGDDWVPPTFKAPAMKVDIRGRGGFAMLPPSLHASGNEYAWEPGRGPWEVEIAELPDWLRDAIDKLREEYARNAGQGVERIPSTAATDAFGVQVDGREERMANIVWGVACDLRRALPDVLEPAGHPMVEAERERAWQRYLFEVKTRVTDAASNEEGLERENRGRTAFLERWNRAIAQWGTKLGLEASLPKPELPPPKLEPTGRFDPWARFNVPAFPAETLPPILSAFVDYQAAALGADPNGVTMAMLTGLSGALDQRFSMRMRRHSDWYEPPRLWTALIGESASKKTPIISAVVGPLTKIERQVFADYSRDLGRWEAAEKDDRAAKPPPPTQYILNDTTVEAAGRILAEQQRGVMMVSDELSGFVGSLDRYGNSDASDRAFWAKSHTRASHSIVRVGGRVWIENLCVAFLGGIQPDRLTLLRGLLTDGLTQRFLPVIISRGLRSRDVDSPLPAQRYGDRISYLSGMKPLTLQFSDGAQAVFETFADLTYELEADVDVYGRGFCSWIGKLNGYFGSLSLLLHINEDPRESEFLEVSERTARNAYIILTEFLIPHGRAFYRDVMDQGRSDDLKAIGSYLLTSDKERFTASDLRSNVRALRDAENVWEMSALLAPFVSGDWLEEEAGGRAWKLEPGVRKQWAERRQTELERKAEIISRFNPKTAEVKGGG